MRKSWITSLAATCIAAWTACSDDSTKAPARGGLVVETDTISDWSGLASYDYYSATISGHFEGYTAIELEEARFGIGMVYDEYLGYATSNYCGMSAEEAIAKALADNSYSVKLYYPTGDYYPFAEEGMDDAQPSTPRLFYTYHTERNSFSVVVNGITPEKKIHYVAYIEKRDGSIIMGRVLTTEGETFRPQTEEATGIGTYVADMNAKYEPKYWSKANHTLGFVISSTDSVPTYGMSKFMTAETEDGEKYSAQITGLRAGTEYHYRACIRLKESYVDTCLYGEVKTFNTNGVEETIGAVEIEEKYSRSAVVSIATSMTSSDLSKAEIGVAYSPTEDSPTPGDTTSAVGEWDDTADRTYTAIVKRLAPATTYKIRAYMKIGEGEEAEYYYGPTTEFTTDAADMPTCRAGEAVDLGLKHKWADRNVGAWTITGNGYYVAWGETTGKLIYKTYMTETENNVYYTDTTTVSIDTTYETQEIPNYYWRTYKYCKDSLNNLTKYCKDADYGTKDDITTLETADDAATRDWGGNWRMATKADWEELIANCTFTWTKMDGVWGYKVTGKNGNWIFLPTTGFMVENNRSGEGTHLYYWTSDLHTDHSYEAWSLQGGTFGYGLYNSSRSRGLQIRAVVNE